jgi:DNA-binding response OmpR family regulator
MNDHRVLIVSSDPSACHGMLDNFRGMGCQLMAVGSSGEAIRRVRSVQPEVVLVDEVSDGQPLQLTPTEFRLLWQFTTLPGGSSSSRPAAHTSCVRCRGW